MEGKRSGLGARRRVIKVSWRDKGAEAVEFESNNGLPYL